MVSVVVMFGMTAMITTKDVGEIITEVEMITKGGNRDAVDPGVILEADHLSRIQKTMMMNMALSVVVLENVSARGMQFLRNLVRAPLVACSFVRTSTLPLKLLQLP